MKLTNKQNAALALFAQLGYQHVTPKYRHLPKTLILQLQSKGLVEIAAHEGWGEPCPNCQHAYVNGSTYELTLAGQDLARVALAVFQLANPGAHWTDILVQCGI